MFVKTEQSLIDQPLQNNSDTSSLPSVAVVILNWNGKKFLAQFLPSVLASTYPNLEIIVADNASTDDSIAFLQQNFPSVSILQNPTNEGFAKGYNSALKKVQGDYYVLLNSDVEVTRGWIEPVIALMLADKTIGACQPKLLAYHDKKSFEYAGASGGWMDSFGYPFSKGRVFDVVEPDNGQYNTAEPCFWASGAALFVKADLYNQLGGLDDYFFAHQEEIDFCWRLQLAGHKVYVQPASVVYHVGGGTLPKESSRKTYLNFRNNMIMLAKNYPLSTALWKIPFRFALDALAAFQGLLKGKGGYCWAIFSAHWGFIKWLFAGKKMPGIKADKQVEINGLYHGSIVYQYFLKKKTTFSEIVGHK